MSRPLVDLLAELQAMPPLSPERRRELDRKIRLEFNYNSNHIEGNTLTYGETELLLIFGKTSGDHELREYEEMKAHDAAFKLIQEWAADPERTLTEADIKDLNRLILKEPFYKSAITPDGQPSRRQIQIGVYKQYPNSVRLSTGEIFKYPSPTETPILMQELMEWFRERSASPDLNAVSLAALLHYKFVRIHPFDDGNGRVARLLMNYVLFRWGYPPVIIKSAEKSAYLAALNRADTGDLEAFVSYIEDQLRWSVELHLKAARGESLAEPGDLEKEIELLKRDLSGKEQAAVPRSAAVLRSLFLDGILPLAEELERKTLPLHELFARTETRLSIDGMGDLSQEWAAIRHPSDPRLRPLLDSLDDQAAGMMQGAIVMLVFSGLKVQLAPRELYIRVEFTFGEYACTLVHPDGLQRSYPYTGSRLQAARSQLAEGWIGKLLGEIRQAGGLA